MNLLLALLLACAPDAPLADEAPSDAPAADALPDAEAPVAGPALDEAVPIQASPPGASLYALDTPVTTHRGEAARIDVARGHPVLLSMFYTTCPMACPLLIQDIQALEAALPPEERAALRVVLVSLDPAHDDAAAMRGVVEQHHLDERWTLAAVPESAVREVAAALGVRYRPLPNGGFAHTAVLTLVDAEGRVVARSEGAEGREALTTALGSLVATR